MISAISSVTNKAVLNNKLQSPSFRKNESDNQKETTKLSYMPAYRDIVVQRDYEGRGILGFVEGVNKDIEISQAQLKIDMLREKFDSIEDDEMKKNILSWMIADAIDEMETIKLHYNEL